ncbi:uncharacterized protein LOC106468342 [Limulus polyphemus]|uniref:Uncharacterized protein LOC106468342 n=1 Tax=Limulus polyphemus TaxID=6850 RepID=A0ABM1T927_LIMPO|nr:uncharacterized protein LOC106468342 [Limulus polyphemus]
MNGLSDSSDSHVDGLSDSSDSHVDGLSDSHVDGLSDSSDSHVDGLSDSSDSHVDGLSDSSDSHVDSLSFFMNSLFVHPDVEVFNKSSFMAAGEGKESFALPINTSFRTEYQSYINEPSATSSARIVVRSVDPREGLGLMPSQSTISGRSYNGKTKKVLEKTSRQSRQSIDGIISGIIKLLGGNVNINRPRPLGSLFPQRPIRRPTVTRINNRGPPDFGTYHQGSIGYHVVPTRPQRPGITDFSLPPLPPPFQTSTAWQFPGVGNISKLLGLIPSENHATDNKETDSTVSNLLFGSAETSITIIPNEPVKPTLSDSTITLKTSETSEDSTVNETSLTFDVDSTKTDSGSYFLTTNLHNDTKEQVLLNLTDMSDTIIEIFSSYITTSSVFSHSSSIDETFSTVTTPGLPNIFSSELDFSPAMSSSSANVNISVALSSQITYVEQTETIEEVSLEDVSVFLSSAFIPSPVLNTNSDSIINFGNNISGGSEDSLRSSPYVQPTPVFPEPITNWTKLTVPSVLEHGPSVSVNSSRDEVKVTTTNILVLPSSAVLDDLGTRSHSSIPVGNPKEHTNFQSSKAESDIPVTISSKEPEIVYGKPSRQVLAPGISGTKMLPSETKVPKDEMFVNPAKTEQMKASPTLTSNSHYISSSGEPDQQEISDFPTGQPFVESVDVNDVRPLSGQSPSNFPSGFNRGPPSVAVPSRISGAGPHQEGTRPYHPQKPQPNSPFFGTPPERPSFRPRPNTPIIRIDTCIVGDESTCDVTLNERCKTVLGVSACYCRAGHARTVPRGPCAPVVTLQVALLLDRYDGQRLTFTRLYQDPNSKQYQRLEYEAEKGLSSIIQSTKLGPDFKGVKINAFSPYATGGILMNVTVHLDERETTRTTLIKETLRKELLEAIEKQNQNLGGSHLYVAESKIQFLSLKIWTNVMIPIFMTALRKAPVKMNLVLSAVCARLVLWTSSRMIGGRVVVLVLCFREYVVLIKTLRQNKPFVSVFYY